MVVEWRLWWWQWRRVTWIGVTLRSTRRRVAKLLSACAVFVSLFLSRWASSQMSSPHWLPFLKALACAASSFSSSIGKMCTFSSTAG